MNTTYRLVEPKENKYVSRLSHIEGAIEICPSIWVANTPVVTAVYDVLDNVRKGKFYQIKEHFTMEGYHNTVEKKVGSFFTEAELLEAYKRNLFNPHSCYGFDYVFVVHADYLKEGEKTSSLCSFEDIEPQYMVMQRRAIVPKSTRKNYDWLYEMATKHQEWKEKHKHFQIYNP